MTAAHQNIRKIEFQMEHEEDEEEGELNESTIFNESIEFRGDIDTSFGSDTHSVSFQEMSAILCMKPDINIYYRTPCSGSSRYSKRTSSLSIPIDHTNRLPESVLLRIFWFLNNRDLVQVIKTCRRFRKIGNDQTLWKFINLEKMAMEEICLHILLDRRLQVIRLKEAIIGPTPQLLSKYNFDELQICHVTHLDLSQTNFSSGPILFRLLNRCRSLQAISLENCELIDDGICREISQNNDLRFLDLVYAKHLSKVGIASLLSNCRKLVEVNFGWAEFGEGAIDMVCKLMPQTVRRLNISGPNVQIDDEKVAALCKTAPGIVELDLSDNSQITERSLDHFHQMESLAVLGLSRCYHIEPINFISMDYLEALNIFGCISQEGLELLRARLPSTEINKSILCTIAKPTVGDSMTSIWGKRTRELY